MNISFDQGSDYSTKQLFNYLRDVDVPDYVKTAEFDDALTLDGLPKTAFADPARKVYPINTPARAYVSNAFFINKKAEIGKIFGEHYVTTVEENIKNAASVYGIESDLESYNSSLFKKEASDYTEKYVATIDNFDLFPYKTASDLKEAADKFVSDIKKYPFQWRKDICDSFLKAASEENLEELPDLVLKYAGQFFAKADDLTHELWRRSTKLKKEANKKVYEELKKVANEAVDVEDVFKIAEICYEVERQEGLYENTKIASILGDPVDKLFGLSIEKAASLLDVVKIGDEFFKIADLQNVSEDIYKQAFGIDKPLDKQAFMDVLPTMPRSDVGLFTELSGIKSV